MKGEDKYTQKKLLKFFKTIVISRMFIIIILLLIQFAFYFAREYYAVVRELPAGKGFADIVFIPRPYHQDKPAVIMELKWNKNVQGAIAQIKEKQYTDALRDYHGNLLLAGITYDRDSKQHTCVIEKMIKE